MITCNILYDDDSELEEVEILKNKLREVYDKQFFFSVITYKKSRYL